jgi:G3E family GTPase
MATTDSRIPATVVTGFLGSGKTTLINRILREQHGRKLAVIVNEFGEVSIDGQLVIHDEEAQLVEFNNGCLCCTVRGDLVDTLGRLQERAGTLDGILIETTGLASRARRIYLFRRRRGQVWNSPRRFCHRRRRGEPRAKSRAEHRSRRAGCVQRHHPGQQMDLVSPERMAAIETRVRQLNPMAKIYHTVNAEIDLADILNVGAFDLVQKLEVDPAFLDDHEHEHDAAIGSFVLEERRPIDINRLMIWMNQVAQSRGEDLYRTKGIFYANGFQERLVFQSVRMLTTLRRDRPWGPDEDRMTQFVVIGKHLDREEFAAGLANCLFR